MRFVSIFLRFAGRFKDFSLLAVSVVFIVVVCVTIVGMFSFQLWQSYNDEFLQAERDSANLARSMSQQAQDTFDEADLALSGIVESLQRHGHAGEESARLHELFLRRVKSIRQLQGIYLFDEAGRWVVTSFDKLPEGVSSSDREYFIFHKNNPEDVAHLGPAIRSRATGEWIIPLSRRINGPQGEFKGVVVAAIKMSYFNSFFEGFSIDSQGAMLVALLDGTVLARRPFKDDYIGANFGSGRLFKARSEGSGSGTVMIKAAVDGVVRIYGYETLDRYPVMVAGAISEDAVFSEWRGNALKSGIGLLVVILLNCFLGVLLIFHVRKEQRIESSLRAAQAALQVVATHDPLTGLGNRRLFEERLISEFKRGTRSNFPLSLIMIDIDFFKSFNDEYGHVEGDHCIVAVAEVVQGALMRDSDLAVRYGGEEIAVILPHTDRAGAWLVAEKIRTALLQRAIPHSGNPLGVVSVSLGCYTCLPNSVCSVDAFVSLADAALYQAKRTGRNKTMVYDKAECLPA